MEDLEADNMKTLYVDEDLRPVIEKREHIPGEALPYCELTAAEILERENEDL